MLAVFIDTSIVLSCCQVSVLLRLLLEEAAGSSSPSNFRLLVAALSDKCVCSACLSDELSVTCSRSRSFEVWSFEAAFEPSEVWLVWADMATDEGGVKMECCGDVEFERRTDAAEERGGEG